ncbi:MAG: imidazoleglycerol-phosphate dehydratase [Lentisphaerae bacterium RIFOXYC12_FULL_60_16]|nr:MAG: imidazoleglycerol-phosphate dehydratase [Lentisphaerae bacterium RIFOXYC12_FULL_60_16]
MKARRAIIERKTRETDIRIGLNLDGAGRCRVTTGIGFMDHMLELLGRHALVDLEVRARGDIHVDYHHTVEDLGIVLGQCLNRALGDRKGIARYGWCLLPMDESLCQCAVDLGGRPYLVYRAAIRKRRVLDFDIKLVEEFMRALVTEARMNLHLAHLYGKEPHHACESMFKALARAVRMAVAPDPRERGIPSSKGRI